MSGWRKGEAFNRWGIKNRKILSLLKIVDSARRRAQLQDDLIAHAFQPMHEPLLDAVLLQFVEVHGTQVSIRLSPLEHVIGDDQNRMPQSDQSAFLPPHV
jgi:hypothetical protein